MNADEQGTIKLVSIRTSTTITTKRVLAVGGTAFGLLTFVLIHALAVVKMLNVAFGT